jgi:hypothetical protein
MPNPSSSHQRRNSQKSQQPASRQSGGKIPLPPGEWNGIDVRAVFAVNHHLGPNAGYMVMHAMSRTVGNFAEQFPEDAEISEREWMQVLNVGPETVRRTKRLLERHGIFSVCRERGGRVRVNHDAIAKLSGE